MQLFAPACVNSCAAIRARRLLPFRSGLLWRCSNQPASIIMRKTLLLLASALFASANASAQEWAKAKLDKSPRHQEWVTVKQGNRNVQCFVVYPEVKDKAPVV